MQNVRVKDANKIHEVPTEEIRPNPYQPRHEFDEASLLALKASIEEYGILEPLIVRMSKTGYELIAGERRLRAAKLLGLKTVPALFKEFNDEDTAAVALIENLEREDLNVVEEAMGYRRLIKEFGFTQEKLALRMGKSRPYITNLLRLLKLSSHVLRLLRADKLSMGQARPLVAVEDFREQELLAEQIIREEMSARGAENLVKRHLKNPKLKEQKKKSLDLYWEEAREELEMRLGSRVRILPGEKKHRLEIEFYSTEDLERILEIMGQSKAPLTEGGQGGSSSKFIV